MSRLLVLRLVGAASGIVLVMWDWWAQRAESRLLVLRLIVEVEILTAPRRAKMTIDRANQSAQSQERN